MKPDFPIYLDSSMRGAFASCPRKFYYEYLHHYKPRRESPDLLAGGAFAAGLEAARREWFEKGNHNTDDCIAAGVQALSSHWGDYEPPEGHVKTFDRMVGALDEYFRQYGFATDYIQPLMQDGKPAIEFSFALPIPDTSHPVSGDPIIYCGRFDMLGVYNNSLFVVDEKTTKQLGASWSKQWTLRSQFTGYCWAAREYGYSVAGAIIRGISILKTKYGHAESLQYRPDWMVERWLYQLQRDVKRMIELWEEDFWDLDLDSSCGSYGGCMYLEACSSPVPEQILEEDFQKRIWNPIECIEQVVSK